MADSRRYWLDIILLPAELLPKTQHEYLEVDAMEAVGCDAAHVYQSTHLEALRRIGIHVCAGNEVSAPRGRP